MARKLRNLLRQTGSIVIWFIWTGEFFPYENVIEILKISNYGMLGHVVSRILFPALCIFRGKIISRWVSNKLYFPGLMCSLLMLVFDIHSLYFEIEEFFYCWSTRWRQHWSEHPKCLSAFNSHLLSYPSKLIESSKRHHITTWAKLLELWSVLKIIKLVTKATGI